MKAYGDAAILAVKMVNERQAGDPVAAWRAAVREKFSHSASLQAKGCPKGAFLGLCSAGFVRGIAPGEYTNSELNRSYAVNAVAYLRSDATLASDRPRLWKLATAPNTLRENSQLDVVLALWDAGLISKLN